MGNNLFNPTNSKIDWKLIVGAVCFGLGWGIGGLCPGPAIAMFSVFNLQIHVVWLGCMIVGQQLANIVEKQLDRQAKEREVMVDEAGSNRDSNSPKKVEFRGVESDRLQMNPSPQELNNNLIDPNNRSPA